VKRLLVIIIVAASLWAGYWFVGSASLKSAFAAWFESRRAEGWAADYSDLTVQGFPNRFDTGFANLSLADPETGLAWQAPFFQILALTYRPNHVIAVWPDQQLVATPDQKYDVSSADMRASLILNPGTALEVQRSTLTASALEVHPQGTRDGTRTEALTLAAERVPAEEAPAYRLGLSADGFAPALPWKVKIDPKGTLPETLDALSADLAVEFDKPWDRTAIEEARPQPRKVKLRLAQAKWGRLELQAAGAVTVDAQGWPSGEVTIKARNWREILQLAVASGALTEGLAGTIEDALSLISQLAGNPKTLDIPLQFRNERAFLGPVPLGPAPNLRLR